MNTKITLAAALTAATLTAAANADHIWINEFHYDNAGADVNEFVEVAFRSGTDTSPSDYSVSLYNGSNGETYGSANVGAGDASTAFPVAGSDQTVTFYTLDIADFGVNGIQNGSPDGLALINEGSDPDSVVQFLSYEGEFAATNGVAAGMTSTDVGAEETSSAAPTSSIALMGTGDAFADFDGFMQTDVATPGAVNTGQVLVSEVIPEPTAVAMIGVAGLGLLARRRRA